MKSFERALFLALTLLLAGCGGGGGESQVDSATAENAGGQQDLADMEGLANPLVDATLATRQRLYDQMSDRYLWFDQLPDIDLNNDEFADLQSLTTRLRKTPEDRFSNVADAQAQALRLGQGVAGSFGLRFFIVTQEPLVLFISAVDDQGTTGLGGLQRGDQILAINGQPVSEIGIDGVRAAFFTDPALGVTVVLTVLHPNGVQRDVEITRTEHQLDTVRKMEVFTQSETGLRAGYVQVTEFNARTHELLDEFRAFMSAQNPRIDELIVDLRYNSGGYVSASAELAGSIYGQSSEVDIYTVLERNALHRDEDRTYLLPRYSDSLTHLSRVFILTTGSTCSASEEVINGLKPFMQVVTIGETTCGKPYASSPKEILAGQVVANILDARSVNALGEGDFYQGLSPVCQVADEPSLPFDDPEESLISAALYYIANEQCPPVPETDLAGSGQAIDRADKSQFLQDGGQSSALLLEPGTLNNAIDNACLLYTSPSPRDS